MTVRIHKISIDKMPRLLATLCLLLAVCLPRPAAADLVIFTDGSFLSVKKFEVSGKKVRFDLRSGGVMVIPLRRVERIVDDEISYEDDLEVAPEEVLSPNFSWRFDAEAHTPPDTPYSREIYAVASRRGLNPALVAAVVRAESAFQPSAVSPKGARGLMQLMPATAERFGISPDHAFKPLSNLDAGSRYLYWLLERYGGDLPRALAAYNAGEGTVDRYGGVPPYRETRDYLQRIYRFLELPLDDLNESLGKSAR